MWGRPVPRIIVDMLLVLLVAAAGTLIPAIALTVADRTPRSAA